MVPFVYGVIVTLIIRLHRLWEYFYLLPRDNAATRLGSQRQVYLKTAETNSKAEGPQFTYSFDSATCVAVSLESK